MILKTEGLYVESQANQFRSYGGYKGLEILGYHLLLILKLFFELLEQEVIIALNRK